MADKRELILASSSPRRKELLSYLEKPFSILPSHIEETVNPNLGHAEVAMDLACQKARNIFEKLKGEKNLVIGADTIVVLDHEILGKPQDVDQARMMLQRLSGKTHDVYTGVSFHFFEEKQKEYSFFEKTKVTFEEIDSQLLELYLATKDSLDKAGAYGIQGPGLPFIKTLQGSYSNVVGFPINRVYQELQSIFKGQFFEIF